MFTLFARLLSFHLKNLDLLERSYKANKQLPQKNKILTNVNFDYLLLIVFFLSFRKFHEKPPVSCM